MPFEIPPHPTEEQLRALSANLAEGMLYQIDSGRDGAQRRFTYVSPAVERLHGLKVEEVMQNPALLFDQVVEEDRRRLAEQEAQAFASRTKLEVEVRLSLPSGVRRWRRFTASPRTSAGGSVVWDGIEMDVTERRQAEDALRASEKRFRSLVEATSDWFWVLDANARYTFASPKIKDLLGYEPQEILGRTPFELMPPDEAARVARRFAQIVKDRRPILGLENVNLHKDGRRVVLEANGVPVFDAAGNFAGYEGMDRDVTERRRAEEALRQRTSELESVFRALPDLYFRMGLDGTIHDYRAGRESDLYAPPEDFVGRPLRAVLPSEVCRKVEAAFEELARGRPEAAIEYALELPAGQKSFEARLVPLGRDQAIAMVRDISERKRAEEALREREQRVSFLLTSTPAVFYTCRPTGDYRATFVSDNITAQLGYQPRQFVDDPGFWLDHIHPDDRAALLGGLQELQSQDAHVHEYRFRHRDGTYRWMRDELRRLRDAEGNPTEMVGCWIDITERKRAEEELRENRFLLTASQAIAHVGSWDLDLATTRLIWSDEVYRMFGVAPHEFGATQAAFFERVHPDDRATVAEAYQRSLDDGRDGFEVEHRIVRQDTGEIRHVHEKCIHVRNPAGDVVRSLGMVQDITDRKQAEADLAHRHRLLEAIGRAQTRFIAHADASAAFDELLSDLLALTQSEYGFIGEVLYSSAGQPYLKTQAITNIAWSDATRAFYQERAPKGMEFLNLKTLFGAVMTSREPVIANDPATDPRRGGLPDGHPPLTAFLGVPVLLGNELVAMAGMANRPGGYDRGVMAAVQPLLATIGQLVSAKRNDAEHKRAAEALRQSEAKYKALIETTATGYVIVDAQGRVLDANGEYVRQTGHARLEEILGRYVVEWTASHDLERNAAEVAKCAARGFVRDLLIDYVRGNGQFTPVEINATVVHGEAGPQILAIVRDITARKNAEAALEQFKFMVEQTGEEVYLANPDGSFAYVNAAAARGLGYTVDELMRLGVAGIDPFYGSQYRAAFERIKDGSLPLVETVHLTKDGRRVHKEIREVWLQIGGRELVCAFGHDITERTRAEAALRASLEEKTALLKEVHHRVKNNLQVISSLLNLQAFEETHGAVVESLRRTQNRVRSMAMLHEMLYRAEGLSRVDFSHYVRTLCTHLCRTFGSEAAQVKLEFDMAAIELDLEQAVPGGLLVNELVSNALKHAFPAGRAGRILVGLASGADRRVCLTVRDDGAGLPPEVEPTRTKTLGLRLVQLLTTQLKGTVAVERDGGTTFRITFPFAAPR